jgi:CBS domain-containing protein
MSTGVYVRAVMSRPVVCATADVTLSQLAAMLAEHHVGAVPVVDDDGQVIGMVTEADLARGVHASGAVVTATDVMSTPVTTVRAEDSVEDALRTMRHLGVGRLPVCDDAGRLVAIVSGSDLQLARPPADAGDADLRRRVIDRVIDAGGEVLAIAVDRGVVRLHIRVGIRGEAPLIERMLGGLPGVARLELAIECIDDAAARPAGPSSLAPTSFSHR